MPEDTELPARPVASTGPGPDQEALRQAYLGLLKLSLCDLVGAGTQTISWTGDQRVFTRELEGDVQFEWRVAGRDWPENALTMVGLRRLDDVQRCVEDIVANDVPGDLIEAGSWRGGTAILMRATLDSLGATDRKVWVADSFTGFPAPEEDGVAEDRKLESEMADLAYLAPSLEQVKSHFARFGLSRGVEFVSGFFETTMSTLRGRSWALVRLDADTYKATQLTLETLYPGLQLGGYLISDDYGFLPACQRAVDEFRVEHGVTEPIVPVDHNGVTWQRQEADSEMAVRLEHAGADAGPAPRVASPPTVHRIPTGRELELSDELTRTQARASAAESELERLQAKPLVSGSAWLRRRLQAARR